jgi:hypothetical protein
VAFGASQAIGEAIQTEETASNLSGFIHFELIMNLANVRTG